MVGLGVHIDDPQFFQKRSFRCTFQTPSYLLIKYRHSGTVWILKGWISLKKTALAKKWVGFFQTKRLSNIHACKKTIMESFVYCMCMNMIYYVYIKIYQVMSVVYRKNWDTVSGTKVLSLKSLKTAQRLICGPKSRLLKVPWGHKCGFVGISYYYTPGINGITAWPQKGGNCESWSEDSMYFSYWRWGDGCFWSR